MRFLVGVALFLVGGCSAAPLPVDNEERAMSLVWEASYGMERESRPRVELFDDVCRTSSGIDSRQRAATVWLGGCLRAAVGNDGLVQIHREPTIAASDFAHSLGMWRQWLLFTAFHADALQTTAQAALEQGGL